MGIDIVHLRGKQLRVTKRKRHGRGHVGTVLTWNHHVIRFARRGVAGHLRVHAGFAPSSMSQRLQDQSPGALTHDESVPGPVERAGRASRIVVEPGGQGPDRAEAGKHQRRDAGLGPCGDDHVRLPGPDAGERLADGVSAGGARGGDGQVRALGPMGHGHDAGRGIQRDHGNEIGMDAVRFLIPVQGGELSFAHHHPAHAGADDHADSVWGFLLHAQSGIRQRLLHRRQGKLCVPVDAIGVNRLQELRRVEIRHLAGDPGSIRLHRKGIEGSNGGNPRAPLQGGFPKLPDSDPDRGNDAQTRDDDPVLHPSVRVSQRLEGGLLVPQAPHAVNLLPDPQKQIEPE